MSFYIEILMGHLTKVMFICELRSLRGRKLLCKLEILSDLYSGTLVVLK